METVYEDTYTVTDHLNPDMLICTAWNECGGAAETLIHRLFLRAYDIGLSDSFTCQVDTGGGILLETIEKMDNDGFENTGYDSMGIPF